MIPMEAASFKSKPSNTGNDDRKEDPELRSSAKQQKKWILQQGTKVDHGANPDKQKQGEQFS